MGCISSKDRAQDVPKDEPTKPKSTQKAVGKTVSGVGKSFGAGVGELGV